MPIKSHDARLQWLEIARWRREAAKAGAPHGISADAILAQSVRFLETSLDQRIREYSDFTEAEHREMQS
jgi:hypothetical protein